MTAIYILDEILFLNADLALVKRIFKLTKSTVIKFAKRELRLRYVTIEIVLHPFVFT